MCNGRREYISGEHLLECLQLDHADFDVTLKLDVVAGLGLFSTVNADGGEHGFVFWVSDSRQGFRRGADIGKSSFFGLFVPFSAVAIALKADALMLVKCLNDEF